MLELKVLDNQAVVVLQFEHSLLSLSKWEQKNKKPFLINQERSAIDMIDYFQDMILGDHDPSLVYRLSPAQLDELRVYVNDQRTASSVPLDTKGKKSGEVVTSELIYSWMTMLEIDWSAESWHLSRLMMLVQIISFKKQPEKKQTQAEKYKSWQEIQEHNKKILGTTEG